MAIGLTVIIISFLYTLLVYIVYASKKKIKSTENKIYSSLIIMNLIGLILELGCCFFVRVRELNSLFSILNIVVNRLFLMYFISWPITFGIYVIYISFNRYSKFNKNLNKYKLISKLVYLISNIIVLILPLYYYSDEMYTYSYGPATNAIVLAVIIVIIVSFYSLFKNIRNVTKSKYYPLFALVFLLIIACIIRSINPGLIVINSGFAFISVMMYFTIENPDVIMLEELYKNKELVESTYEDKSNFLFEMTGEVREPLLKLEKITDNMINKDIPLEIKEDIKEINMSVKQLDFVVNDVLNVTSLDSNKLKIINNRYNLKYLYDDVFNRVEKNITKNIEFRKEVPHNMPILYGDSIKIKQVLYSILMNSVNKTNNGFIEFKVDLITKYDVCRVIFTIMDSGVGMSIDKINDILSQTGEFSENDIVMLEKSEINAKLCQKVIKVLGGNLLIKSEPGKGTKVILTIDQKVHNEDNKYNILNNYESAINSSKKVLIVSQNKKEVELIKNKLSNYNISYSHILYGMDAIDRIKSCKKYDYIIVDDDMKEMSGYSTLKELKNIKNFKIPVIIMLSDNKKEIKDHYLNDGFSDYILVSEIDNEIDKIVKKY